MRSTRYFPLALALTFALLNCDPVDAFPVNADAIADAAPASDVLLARAVVHGPRGGVAVRGPRGVAVRGPRGGVAIGGRYGGGIWYGTGRRFWGGRWWPYGVGACWRSTSIGFVWVCG
jgi:hypothetical protein